jgi:PilZ domain-containing protein
LNSENIERVPATEGRERRRTIRYGCEGDVEVCKVPSTGMRKGKLRNLSLGGCYIELELPYATPTYVEVMMRVHGHSFRVTGTVRKTHKAGIGVEFDKLSSGARHLLSELITELDRSGKHV